MTKYGSKRVDYDVHSFASQLERAVYIYLKSREQQKEISDLKCQETIYLTKARIIYKPDFSFLEDNIQKYAEAKGMETPEWRLKRKLWQFYGPGPLEVWKGSANNFVLHETIIPG
jgi:predicted nuclease of restriction endonuclease-like RecB superfamily